MVRALSIPRPAYSAAHRPAGPAPMMMTYSCCLCSAIRSEFQSRGITLPRQGPRQLRAEMNRLELHVAELRPGELLERRRAHHHGAVPVAAFAVQQRRGGLNQSLKGARLGFLNNRTPHGFQRLVGEPILPRVEQLARVLQVAPALLR